MKLVSWNVRGLGNPGAQNALRQLLTDEKPNVLFISETKLNVNVFERFCRSCGYSNVIAHSSDGASGGVGICWDSLVNINLLSYDSCYIDVDVLDDGDGNRWRLTGFYGNPELSLRHESWDLLRALKSHSDLPWLCIGDFNEIMYSYEKKGGRRRNRSQMEAFLTAVNDCEFIDLGYHGTWYTWQRGGVNSPLIRCRLDRGLATNEWWELIPNFTLRHMVNAHSDHSPLLLLTGSSNVASNPVGLPPKRFCASWVHDSECEEVVRKVWSETTGSAAGKIPAVLKALHQWSSAKFGGRKRRKKKLQKRLDRLTILDPNESVINEMLEVKSAINLEIEQEEALWAQRAHINWLREGDQNTTFFHKSASHRRRVNTVRNLARADGTIEKTTVGMLRIAVDYFKNIFSTSNPINLEAVLDGIQPKVDYHMNEGLSCEYTAEEVRTALFSMGPNKASGPDGMTAQFYQKFWPIVGEEVTHYCLQFLNGDRDIGEINGTNIVLIPKVNSPERMQHFRPISLSNVLYKIIAKTLANRFKGVLESCIDPAQSAFIPGRLITDNVLIAYELLHTLQNSRSGSDGRFALKMDMSKAYDRVEWSYLEAIMKKLGLHGGFVEKVMRCVQTVSYSVIMNGTVSEVFRPTRGIRQGDPLSTYLFLFCSEGLSSLLRVAKEEGRISGLQASTNGPALTHLLFADDSIIFGEAFVQGAQQLRDLIYTYGRCSGQLVNYDKSLVYFSSNSSVAMRNAVKSALRVRVENNPERYLGLPSMVGRNRTTSFQYLRDKMNSKVQNWSTRFLSQAGKEVFIKSVLQSLPTYAMGCFLLPRGLCDKMNGVISKYWWRGKEDEHGIYWAKWSKVCKPKSMGGLGFRELGKFNIAMLAKQGWRLLTNPSSLVAQVLKAKYYPQSSFLEARVGNSPSLTWRSVWSARGLLEKGVCWRIGNGLSARIWFDQWVPGLPPVKITPLITRLNPIGRVAEFIDYHTMEWKEAYLREVMSADDVDRVLSIPLPTTPQPDVLAWQYDTKGIYSVSSGYKVLADCHSSQIDVQNPLYNAQHDAFYKKLWNYKLPPKVLHLIWKVFKNYTSTQYVLYNKYIAHTPVCPRCNLDDETGLHAFRDCASFSGVWGILNIQWTDVNEIHSVQEWLIRITNSNETRTVHKILLVIWANWSNQNKFIHEGVITEPNQLAFFVEMYLLEYERAQTPKARPSTRTPVQWSPPQIPFYKCNFDTSYEQDTHTSYSGAVIRDAEGLVKAAAAIEIPRVMSPLMGEAFACLHVLQLAFSMNYTDLVVEGDSKTVINFLNENSVNRSEISQIITDCKQLARNFHQCRFEYKERTSNRCAHTLARERGNWMDDLCWVNETPPPIELLVTEEQSTN